MMSRDCTELEAWMEGKKLVSLAYILTTSFPKKELSGLANQVRRIATSVPLNIAEGYERRTSKDDALQFLHTAQESLCELETKFCIALDQKYVSKVNFEMISKKIHLSKKLTSGFINYYKKTENEKFRTII
ncbi:MULTISPECIES: four helix bundle protein [Chryseobacterium]|nr:MULTISPECIES: four helix bundle protein [Chryseobacterium]